MLTGLLSVRMRRIPAECLPLRCRNQLLSVLSESLCFWVLVSRSGLQSQACSRPVLTVVTVRITSSGLHHRIIASESQDCLGEAENQSSRLILFHPVRELLRFQLSPRESTRAMPSCRALGGRARKSYTCLLYSHLQGQSWFAESPISTPAQG